MITCNELSKLVETLCKEGESRACIRVLEVLAIIASEEPVGRLRISALSGETERKVRNIISMLREKNIIQVHREAGAEIRDEKTRKLFSDLACTNINNHICVAAQISDNLRNLVSKHYLSTRDYIVLGIGEADILRALAIISDAEIKIPGMPNEYAKNYTFLTSKCLKEIESKNKRRNIIVLIYKEGYKNCYYLIAVTLYALYQSCVKLSP